MMKVVFKIIKAASGNDIYFQRLAEALKRVSIDSEIEYYPKLFQYFPILLKIFNKRSSGDIIHSNVEYGWVFKEKGKPLFVTLHHNVFDKEYEQFITWKQKIYYNFILKSNIKKSLKAADKTIAVSKFTRDSFIRSFGKYDIQVIYNFINTDKYKPKKVASNDKRFKLLFIGNLIRRKGADLLPKIMSNLGEDFVLYYTCGLRTKTPEGFNLSNMISLGRLSEEDLINEYNKCDALLFPSRLEGFGYAIAEAMACGKPIIAANNSSISELVMDRVNGFICRQNDEKDFVAKIKLLRRTPSSKYMTGNRNRIVNSFGSSNMIKYYEKIY